MTQTIQTPELDLDKLRRAIQEEYALVAQQPEHGFHFLVGRPLTQVLGYEQAWLEGIPEPAIATFAGTGNPFSVGRPQPEKSPVVKRVELLIPDAPTVPAPDPTKICCVVAGGPFPGLKLTAVFGGANESFPTAPRAKRPPPGDASPVPTRARGCN
jgi:hypothetical protein